MDRWLKKKGTTPGKEDDSSCGRPTALECPASTSSSEVILLSSMSHSSTQELQEEQIGKEDDSAYGMPTSIDRLAASSSGVVLLSSRPHPSTQESQEEQMSVAEVELESEVELSSRNDNKNENPHKKPSTKGVKKIYKKKFMPEWLKLAEFKNWLLQGKNINEAMCKVCNITIKAGKSDLQKHASGKNHKRNMEIADDIQKNQPQVSSFISQNAMVKNTEAAICSFIVENNLPISSVEPLVNFIKSLPEKSVTEKIQLAKQKATNVLRNGLRPFYQEKLLEKLKDNFFSIYIDESTDVSVKKQLAIMVSYCSDNFDTEVDIIDLVECPDGTAISLYNTMIKSMNDHNIPLENWIGFCADTTSAMMGQYNSVSQLIRKNFPQVHIAKCVCHMIHLVASYACTKLSNSLEDLCRTVYNHFSRSPKNSQAYKEFQAFFDIKPHKILKPCQTRWLSLQSCVRRILEQWEALEHYWRILCHEDPTHANFHTHKTLQNLLLKSLMYFVDYSLGLFNNFNTLFQQDFPQFPDLKAKVDDLIKTLALNFMEKKYVKETPALNIDPLKVEEYVELKDVYMGVQAMSCLNDVDNKDPAEVKKLHDSAREFYIEAISQIQKRFVFEEIHNDASFVLPENARDLEPPSLYPIAKRYIKDKDQVKIDEVDNEWRYQSLVTNNAPDIVTYWKTLFQMKENGKPKFVHLPILVKYFLALPYSNAVVERLFSAMKVVKTEKRNRLDNETISAILSIKYGLKRTNMSSVGLMSSKFSIPHLKFVQSNASAAESKQIRMGKKGNV